MQKSKSQLKLKTYTFFILIFTFFISAVGMASASSHAVDYIPDQLFDINLTVESNAIRSIDELSANGLFVSFGRVPTAVDLTFSILDSTGERVYEEKDNIVVETEFVLNKKFADKELDLPPGKYTLVMKTLYNISVEDEFKQKFEILKEDKAISWLYSPSVWIAVAILTFVIGLVATKINQNYKL